MLLSLPLPLVITPLLLLLFEGTVTTTRQLFTLPLGHYGSTSRLASSNRFYHVFDEPGNVIMPVASSITVYDP